MSFWHHVMRKRGPRCTLAAENSHGHAYKLLQWLVSGRHLPASISGYGLNPSLSVASTETVNLGDLAMKEVQSTSHYSKRTYQNGIA
jgi:hypothetical protein